MHLSTVNKTSLNKSLSSIIENFNAADQLPPNVEAFVLDICRRDKTLGRLANAKDVKVCIMPVMLRGKYRTKMIHLCVRKKCTSVSKTRLVNLLFPPGLKSNIPKIRAALREAISPQISVFRSTIALPQKCAITGHTLIHWGQIHVDHEPPFVLLVENWLIENNLYYDEINVKDPQILSSWCTYHLKNAKLRVTFRKANMEKGANGFSGTTRATRPANLES